MIHFLVVGEKGEWMGIGNEIKQTIQGIFGDENAWKSAFFEQDLYSNNLGARFFNIYSDQIALNPTCLARYIQDFLLSKDRGFYLPNPPDFKIHK